ncbi:MAG: gfo/Idh/MocA family oxidoreductase [Spirochaetaceae bacterium]|nr:MAG: gfo/Idh/MocA family oxidoreductase [Spirochaetaceae bacterium]
MKPVQWGVLGVSDHYIKRVHVPVRSSDRCEVRAIASRSQQKAEAAAARLGIPAAYGSYEDLLGDANVEAVYIPLPNHMHLEYIRKCADAGKHVLCEKPMGLNAGEVQQAIEYTTRKGVMLMEAFMYRFHPQWTHLRDLVQSGEIGTVHALQSSFFYSNTDPRNIRNILETGGGAIYDIGCYCVSSARFVTDREPHRVVARVTRDPQFGTDVLSSGILDFGDVQTTFVCGTQTFPHQHVNVFGSGGSAWVEIPFNIYPDVPVVTVVRNGVGERVIKHGPVDQYRLQFDRFSLALREGAPAPTPPDDALANQKVLDALFASEKSGGWEKVG